MFVAFAAAAQEPNVGVVFLQDGKEIKPDGDRIALKREPFEIRIKAVIDEGVLVGVTFDDAIYYSATGRSDAEAVGWFENTGMADALFNPSESVMLSDEAPNYWFYSTVDEHRFDSAPKIVGDYFIGTRTIANIAALDPYRLVSLDQLDDDLFLVFYQVDYDNDDALVRDIQGFRLVWERN